MRVGGGAFGAEEHDHRGRVETEGLTAFLAARAGERRAQTGETRGPAGARGDTQAGEGRGGAGGLGIGDKTRTARGVLHPDHYDVELHWPERWAALRAR
ncbi:hypothetical protein ABZ726_31625, partial [Streptomyces hundungensis]